MKYMWLCLLHLSLFCWEANSSTTWKQKCRKGHPCDISGPANLNDKIAVVGGGPAGIHMAYLLKKRGFRNIKIFEESCRVGGKSYTINYRGTPHDMGTVYLAPDYEENIIRLATEFNVGKLINLPAASVWVRGKPLTYTAYVMQETMMYLRTRNVSSVARKIGIAMHKYIQIHLKLFGNYDGELMPRPSPQIMHQIRGTFKEFLQRHKLYILRPLFLASHTVQGYGQLDEVPAFYGLMWNTPKLINGLIARMQGKANTGIYMLEHGFQPLWEKIVDDMDLHVSYDSRVMKVKRDHYGWDGGITVYYRKKINPWRFTYEREQFDFVVWTPEMRLSLGAIDADDEEEELFHTSKVMYFTTSLMNSQHVPRGPTSIDYWMQLIESKKNHVVWAQRDSYAALKGFNGTRYQNGEYPNGADGKPTRTTVVYQMGRYKPSESQLVRIIKRHFKHMGGKVDIRATTIWRYFPRYSDGDLRSGILWDILDHQGTKGMWYAGSSVCFESVKSVVEYNELLVDIMSPPMQGASRKPKITNVTKASQKQTSKNSV